MPPANGQPGQQFSIEEFKPVLCKKCRSKRRAPLTFQEIRQHRFRADITVTVTTTVGFCLGCEIQLDLAGSPVLSDHPEYLSIDERNKLLGLGWKMDAHE